MALPVLDAAFASSADLPRRQLLSKWLVNTSYSGTVDDFYNLPERYLYAKIAVELGGPRTEQEYIELPKSYAWSDIYGAIIFNRTAPASPSNLTLTPLTSSSMRLNWVTNGASVAYSVERSVDGAAFQVIGTTAIGATTATNTGLNIASNYQYRIRGSSGGYFTGYSNTASASTYDANASSFVATSGATDIVAINDFVLGVKTLGLWNSMVCWPLRSSQNAGSGTTAYSLGGLGTYNGTLTNGPTWGADGMDFDGSNDHVALPNESFGTGNAATSIWAFAKNDTNAVRMGILSQGNVNTATDAFSLQSPLFDLTNDAGAAAFTTQTIAAKSLVWKSLFLGNTSAGFVGKDGGAITEFVLSNTLNKTGQSCAIGIFGSTGTVPFDGLIAAVIRINATPTTALNGQIYTLYKATLGSGLSLP